MTINGLQLILTCSACPEQYDVFQNEKQVGYLRLRHGHFRAHMDGPGGKLVYESKTQSNNGYSNRIK